MGDIDRTRKISNAIHLLRVAVDRIERIPLRSNDDISLASLIRSAVADAEKELLKLQSEPSISQRVADYDPPPPSMTCCSCTVENAPCPYCRAHCPGCLELDEECTCDCGNT